MGELPFNAEGRAEPVNQLDLLRSRAQEIIAGSDRWTRDEFRDGFAARVRAGEDPLGDRYTAIRSAADRRPQGVTLTPHRIVKAMIGWAEKEARALGSPGELLTRALVPAGSRWPPHAAFPRPR
jgi:hypothetical protein